MTAAPTISISVQANEIKVRKRIANPRRHATKEAQLEKVT